jgi:hypothetical protein
LVALAELARLMVVQVETVRPLGRQLQTATQAMLRLSLGRQSPMAVVVAVQSAVSVELVAAVPVERLAGQEPLGPPTVVAAVVVAALLAVLLAALADQALSFCAMPTVSRTSPQ